MSEQTTTAPSPDTSTSSLSGAGGCAMALVLVWSSAEPQRIGEVALLANGDVVQTLGRDTPASDGVTRWVRFGRSRPGEWTEGPPLAGPGISREQLLLRAYLEKNVVLVERFGRCPTFINGHPLEREGVVVPGDTLLLKGQALFYCISRPLELLPLRYFKPNAVGAYGEADRYGIIGEGEAIWRVREELAFHAELDEHVLVLGPSGTGKELAARAIHAMSRRANGPFVACSAANFPSGLVEAELFGNAKNYPNPGTPARKGLVGEAEHGTLFLDEIGELPHTLQAHLLRMLDTHGEYHRLGEAQIQRADIRVIAATNRDPSELKHDLAARLKLRATMPPLDARREDIPLLLRARMRRLASDTPSIGVRFMGDRGEPRLDPALVDTLLRSTYSTGVRELERILFAALSASPGDRIMLSSELRTEIPQAPRARFAPAPTDEQVRESLERHGDNVTRAAQELGVSRFSLHRLIKKLK